MGERIESAYITSTLQDEIAKMFVEVRQRKPDAMVLLARVGDDLIIRLAGTPDDVVSLYTDTPEEVGRSIAKLVRAARERHGVSS